MIFGFGHAHGAGAVKPFDPADPLMEKAFTHEIGHLLGTSHGEGVMRPVLSGGCIDRRAAVQAALDTAARKASQCRVIGGKP